MVDVLAVRDEDRAQNWAMVLQTCSRQRGLGENLLLLAPKAPQANGRGCCAAAGTPLEPIPESEDILQVSAQ